MSRTAAGAAEGSWRKGQPRNQPSSPESLQFKRVLVTLLGLVLLGALAWVVWRLLPAGGKVHLVRLSVSDYDLLHAPPLGFAQEGRTVFDRLGQLEDAQVSSDWTLQGLGAELEGAALGTDDVLIVFVPAHGISRRSTEGEGDHSDSGDSHASADRENQEGGPEAYLVQDNYESRTSIGLYQVAELLDELRKCPAKTKLLVIDAGRMDSDPHAGLLVNEFPRLLEEAVNEAADPNLWVLSSHGMLEYSHVSHVDRCSVFSHFVAEGLQGAANADDDHKISLAELYSYLAARVTAWVWQDSNHAEIQTPQLLHGGRNVGRAATVALTSVPKAPSGAKPASKDASPTKKTTAASGALAWPAALALARLAPNAAQSQQPPQPAAEPAPSDDDQRASDGQPAAGSAQGEPEPAVSQGQPAAKQPGAAPGKPKQQGKKQPPGPALRVPKGYQQQFAAAWKWHAEQNDQERLAGWSPADFAPHVWRQYQERLLAREARFRAGVISELGGADLLAGDRLLKSLQEQIERLGEQFDSSMAQDSYLQHCDVLEAVRLRSKVLLRAPDYVRWCVRTSAAPPQGLYGSLLKLLEEAARLSAALSHPPVPADDGTAPDEGDVARWLNDVRQSTHSLGQLRSEVKKHLASEIRELTSSKGRTVRGESLRIEALLSTPLLKWNERLELVSRLHDRRRRARLDAQLSGPSKGDRQATLERSWKSVRNQAELEYQLARLVSPSGGEDPIARALRSVESSWARVGKLQASDKMATRWDAYGRLGLALEAFYGSLSEIVADESILDVDRRRVREDCLRLLDARDLVLAGIDPRHALVPLPDLGLESDQLALLSPVPQGSVLAVQVGTALPVEWKLRSACATFPQARLKLEYEGPLEVERDGEPIASGAEWDVTLGEREIPIVLAVRATRESGGQARMKLSARPQGQRSADVGPVEAGIALALPAPGSVELVLRSSALAEPESITLGQQQKLVLRPFPSGQSDFSFTLRSSGQQSKSLDYRWSLLPAPQANERPRRDPPWSADGKLVAGCELLSTGQVTLPPAGEAAVLPVLPAPKPEEPPAPPVPEAATGAAPAAPAAEPPGQPAHGGLVLEVTDPAANETHRVWVDIEPLHPASYLKPTVIYKRDKKRIEIEIRPLRGLKLPAEGSLIVWELDDPLLINSNLPKRTSNDDDRLLPGVEKVDLFAAVEPDEARMVAVNLWADGYPRAFLYDVLCDDVQRGEVPRKERTLRHLSMVEPPERLARPNPSQIHVKLRADARPGAFREGYEIRAGIKARGEDEHLTERFFADRQSNVRLVESKQPGAFGLTVEVKDIEFDLNTSAYRNQVAEIVARMLDEQGDELRMDHKSVNRRSVIFDGTPPTVEAPRMARVTQGKDLVITVAVDDNNLSGAKKVEFDFDKGNPDELQDPKPARQQDDGRFQIRLPTADLTLGDHTLLVRAIDNVELLSRIAAVRVQVVAEPGPGEEMKNNSLVVAAVINRQPVPEIGVTVTGAETRSGTTNNRGECRFDELPPGQYMVQVMGTYKNKMYEAEGMATVQPPPAKPSRISVDLAKKKKT